MDLVSQKLSSGEYLCFYLFHSKWLRRGFVPADTHRPPIHDTRTSGKHLDWRHHTHTTSARLPWQRTHHTHPPPSSTSTYTQQIMPHTDTHKISESLLIPLAKKARVLGNFHSGELVCPTEVALLLFVSKNTDAAGLSVSCSLTS